MVGCGSVDDRVRPCTRARREGILERASWRGENRDCLLHVVRVKTWEEVDVSRDLICEWTHVVVVIGGAILEGK